MSVPDYLRKWRDIIFAPRDGSNNFFNIGITCHHFGKLTTQMRNKSPRRYQDNWAGNWSEIRVVVRRRTILNDASVGGVDDQHVGLGPAGDFGWD